jgi:hypothetical protein
MLVSIAQFLNIYRYCSIFIWPEYHVLHVDCYNLYELPYLGGGGKQKIKIRTFQAKRSLGKTKSVLKPPE